MEVTYQLRTTAVNKKGLAPIQITFCWDSNRLRLGSGEKCRPADWNEKTGKVKDKPSAFAGQVNQVLERWATAGSSAHQDARQAGEFWDAPRMETEIRVRYQRLLDAAAGRPAATVLTLPEVGFKPLTFFQQMERWLEYKEGYISLRNGKPLSRNYLNHLRKLQEKLQEFERRHRFPLRFESMDPVFYGKFQSYCLSELGHDVNTFGCMVKYLKNFLYWCAEHDVPVNMKFTRFAAPDRYVGVDALTQAEVLAWASVDLQTPEARAYLEANIDLKQRKPGQRGGRPPLTLEDHMERIELARDKFLQCVYTGLRISDADRMAQQHIHGKLLKIEAGKTGITCLIPFFDDDVFKPVALVAKYAGWALLTCLPDVPTLDDYLPLIQHLAGIHRIQVTTRIGRKTFATLKIYQGVPRTQVMLATGHKTEKSFLRYLGVDEKELIEMYERTARQVA
ncbi:phage integrase SAM-like domain-containing protein [Hymenobacter pini]|uniref:phage integrase SAM-like domain-containing protein n=1 Tax=Hymenobacter pini TaxID=2880879 RepID=UPI001CF1D3F3|nr:phage integrase SAM-like domain-containing protein [Hymenobacter pini]MCA8830571.1 phage integrase SAM-like domain-containing protein [Hymenobacter pini]